MSTSLVDYTKIWKGMRVTLGSYIVLSLAVTVIWFAFNRNLDSPIGIIALFVGGAALLIGGFIGPGRYRRTYPLVLYHPADGGSYDSYVKIGGFVIDENITEANLVINNRVVEKVKFKDGYFEKVYKEEDLLSDGLNMIWLDANGVVSNKSFFTFYDPQDFTKEEIEEIENDLANEFKHSLQEAKQLYIEDRSAHTGSFTLGLILGAILLFTLNYILSR